MVQAKQWAWNVVAGMVDGWYVVVCVYKPRSQKYSDQCFSRYLNICLFSVCLCVCFVKFNTCILVRMEQYSSGTTKLMRYLCSRIRSVYPAVPVSISVFFFAAFGGIYLDTDEVILQPMDDLMKHHVTMAWERRNAAFGNGLFLAEPNNTFLNTWYAGYKKFSNSWWAYFSTTLPRVLYNKHPEYKIHVVDTFFRPNLYNITGLFYEGRYDWSNHYALHLYYRRNQKYFKGNFEQKNTTLGDVARHILFGDKKRCLKP